METLESLAQFVEKFPQLKREEIKYAFTGGTAVRLHQEKTKLKKKDFFLIWIFLHLKMNLTQFILL